MNHTEIEEEQHCNQRKEDEVCHILHSYILLPAHLGRLSSRALHLASGEPHGLAYDATALDDAYNAGHSDAADAYHTCIFAENIARRHSGNLRRAIGS